MIQTEKKMLNMIQPHGGKLCPLMVNNNILATEKDKASKLPIVRMSSRETSDLIMMAIGAFWLPK